MRRLSLFFAAQVLAAIVFSLAVPKPAWADYSGPAAAAGINEPLSYVLMERAANDPAHSKALLEQALRNTPDLPPVYFSLGAADLKEFPGGLVSWFYYVLEGVKAYARNWWWAIDLSGLIGVSLIASFFASLFIAVCLRLPRELPLLKHDIGEQRRQILLLLVPAVSAFFGPGLFLASMLLLLGVYFQRRDRILVYLVLFFFAFTPFITGWVKSVYLVSAPEMRAVVAVNEGTDNSLALDTLAGSRDFDGLFSYGLALSRAGRTSEAIAVYSAAIEKRKDPRAYINLANCYMLLGDPRKAGELYTASIQIKPTAPAYFDLAQLNRNALNYEKGDALYKQASALDPAGVTSFMARAGQNAGNLLMDDALGMDDFYLLFEKTRAGVRSGARAGLLWPILLLWLAVFFYYGRKGRMRAFRCSRCGRILCDRCEVEPYWGRMCRDCYQSLVQLEAQDPKKRVAKLLQIHGSQLKRGAFIRALGFAPPGIAYIYGGCILQGMLMLWAFLFFAVAALLNPLFATGLGTWDHSWLGIISAVSCGLLYILSCIGIRRRQGREWL